MDRTINIHTDGISLSELGPGGYAALIDLGDSPTTITGGDHTTNQNRMGLIAIIKALEALDRIPGTTGVPINLYSTHRHIVDSFNQGWVRNWQNNRWRSSKNKEIQNPDIWQILLRTVKGRAITYAWSADHAPNDHDDLCSQLALDQAETAQDSPDPEPGPPVPDSPDPLLNAVKSAFTDTMPPLFRFSVASRPKGINVRTPLIYPHGDPVAVFIIQHHAGLTVTDRGDTLKFLQTHDNQNWNSEDQELLVKDVCQTLNVEPHDDALTVHAPTLNDIGDAVIRTAQAALQIATLTRINKGHSRSHRRDPSRRYFPR